MHPTDLIQLLLQQREDIGEPCNLDAAVTRARLIASQIQTLGYLHQYDTAKLQMGASRR